MAVLEAWSYGVPVLMTPECNLPGAYVSGAALRIELDVTSLSDALCNLAAMDVNSLSEIGNAGHLFCRRHFNADEVALQFQEVYKWLSGIGPRPYNVES